MEPSCSISRKTTMKSTELLELVIQRIPYPHQVSDIDVTTSSDTLYFTWRGDRYRVKEIGGNLDACEYEQECLIGSNIAILMREVLSREPFGEEAKS